VANALLDRLDLVRDAMPAREFRAVELWAGQFYPFQLAWVLDFSTALSICKSRKIGGSFALAGAVALWTILGERTCIVSIGEDEATAVLATVQKHLEILTELGSRWARSLRRKYIIDGVLRVASGGQAIALAATKAGRSHDSNVMLDEHAYHFHPERVFEAAGAAALLGKKRIRVVSTPDGTNAFYELHHDPDPSWRHSTVRLSDARAQGYVIDDKKVRAIDRGVPELHAQLFECSFKARGAALFIGCQVYSVLPATYRICIGLDLAYTANTSSDYNAAVVLLEHDGYYYVAEVVRRQALDFTPDIESLHRRYPSARFWFYSMRQEAGLVNLMRERLNFPVFSITARDDKFTRALPTASAWNDGRIGVPQSAPWLRDFISEVNLFAGTNRMHRHSEHDDQVDALVAAYDQLRAGVGTTVGAPIALTSQFGNGGYAPDANGFRSIRTKFAF
jgi:predicted phage terminase large subunit-like protein